MVKRFLCRGTIDAAAIVLSIGLAAPASAQGLQATHRVTAPLALEAVGAAVAHCAGQGYFVSAVVVDASGVRQAVLRGDNAGVHTMDSAMGKAYTAASFKAPTGATTQRIMGNPAAAGIAHVPGVLFAQGGIPIKLGDEVIGGIGVGGSPGGDKDEACAQAGLDKISDRLK